MSCGKIHVGRAGALFLLTLLSVTALSGAESAGRGRFWRGVFEPRAEAVIPSEISMRVAAMPKGPGDQVQEGDLLVEFDAALPEAVVASAQARLRAVEVNHNSMKSLFAKNQVTAVELARAESELAQARLEVTTAERDVRSCRVLAPFSGKLVERKVREFEWANRGAPLLLLVDDAVLKVKFFLPEDNFSAIKLGDKVRIAVPAASREVWGEVSRLGVVFDPVSRTFDVWADVPNVDDSLRAGMTAEVEWPATEGEGG